jgi:hypothetical protein
MGYGRVLDEVSQNIHNKRVSRKIFQAKDLAEILRQFPPKIFQRKRLGAVRSLFGCCCRDYPLRVLCSGGGNYCASGGLIADFSLAQSAIYRS